MKKKSISKNSLGHEVFSHKKIFFLRPVLSPLQRREPKKPFPRKTLKMVLNDASQKAMFVWDKTFFFTSMNKVRVSFHTSKKSPITQSGHRKRSRRPFQMTRVCKMFKIIQNFYFLEFHGKQTNRGQFLTILDKIVFFCLFLRFWVFFTICFSKCINNGDVETLGFTFIC